MKRKRTKGDKSIAMSTCADSVRISLYILIGTFPQKKDRCYVVRLRCVWYQTERNVDRSSTTMSTYSNMRRYGAKVLMVVDRNLTTKGGSVFCAQLVCRA